MCVSITISWCVIIVVGGDDHGMQRGSALLIINRKQYTVQWEGPRIFYPWRCILPKSSRFRGEIEGNIAAHFYAISIGTLVRRKDFIVTPFLISPFPSEMRILSALAIRHNIMH